MENLEKNKEYSFFLDGDLCQMSTQKKFLLSHGFDIKQNDVYPCLKPTDRKKALKLIWEQKCEGWWHYQKDYAELEICTEEEFKNAF